MAKKLIASLCITLFFLFFTSVSFAQTSEQIENYEVGITVHQTGEFDVVETIKYNFGFDQRHGIFRDIPFIIQNDEGKDFKLKIDNIAVVDELGSPHKFVRTKSDANVNLKIGDPDITITGVHTYVISYTVSGGMRYFSDHDELFWNAIGTDWAVPILASSVVVKYPGSLASNYNATCFTGYEGSTDQSCLVSTSGSVTTITSSRSLYSHEGLTVVLGFPKGAIAVLEPIEVVSFFDTPLGQFVAFLLFMVGSLWYVIYPIWVVVKWFRYGRDADIGYAPTAYFDAPKTKLGRALTPGETGTLIDETVHVRDIMSTIVDLARRGYLIINEKKKKEFHLIKQKAPTGDSLAKFEKELLNGIFKDKNDVNLKKAKLVTTVNKVEDMLYKDLITDGFFPEDPKKIRTFYQVMGVLGLMSANLQLAFAAFIFGRVMPRKTDFGALEANKAKGLLNFLKSQDRQLKFQADKQMMFEKLLPYAVAFGVEKIWMERFKDIKLVQPDWYQSYRPYNQAHMMSGMRSSMSSFKSAATPTSSSTGHSSGFSGGGFSGGGGGGGGGGSW